MKGKLVWFSMWTGTAAAIAYGIVHDQITIRICPDYFLVWHPRLLETQDLTLVALAWGVVATWWMGAFLGFMIGLASTVGKLPLAPKRLVVKALAWTMAASGVCAVASGLAASAANLTVPSSIQGAEISLTSIENQHRFAVDLAIHNASYFAGALGAFIACIAIALKRARHAAPARPTE